MELRDVLSLLARGIMPRDVIVERVRIEDLPEWKADNCLRPVGYAEWARKDLVQQYERIKDS